MFWLSPDAVNDVYMFEAPAVSFVLCNVIEDGPFRGIIYNLRRKLYMYIACIAFMLWAPSSPPVAYHISYNLCGVLV